MKTKFIAIFLTLTALCAAFGQPALAADGAKWIQEGSTWYYLNDSGAMQTGWLNDGGTWYYLTDSGARATGWVSVDGVWYYLYNSGSMATGWVSVDDTWYYMNGSGAMQTGWLNDGGTWYYLTDSGAMATGWASVDGVWYYLYNSGSMATGWVSVDGTWYYMNGSGAMQTGWLKLSGTWYYLRSSGAMVTGSQTINRTTYRFDDSGAYITPSNGNVGNTTPTANPDTCDHHWYQESTDAQHYEQVVKCSGCGTSLSLTWAGPTEPFPAYTRLLAYATSRGFIVTLDADGKFEAARMNYSAEAEEWTVENGRAAIDKIAQKCFPDQTAITFELAGWGRVYYMPVKDYIR